MAAEDIDALKIKLEHRYKVAEKQEETKRYAEKQGVRRIIYGTAVVAVAAAAFPFFQELSTSWFAEKIEASKQAAQIAVLKEKHRLELERLQKSHMLELERISDTRKNENRAYFEDIADEARSDDMAKRINIAEFFSFLADSPEQRDQWVLFREHLYQIQEKLNQEREAALTVLADSQASEAQKSAAQERLGQIQKRENPGSVPVIERSVSRIVIVATRDASLDELRKFSQSHLGWSDIGENLIIRQDGEVQIARPINEIPAVAKRFNEGTIGIGMACDLRKALQSKTTCQFTKAQITSLTELVLSLMTAYDISSTNIFSFLELRPALRHDYVGALVSDLRDEIGKVQQ